MVAILGLGHIQVKEEIVKIVTEIRREGMKFQRSKNGRAQGAVHSISRLILSIVDL